MKRNLRSAKFGVLLLVACVATAGFAFAGDKKAIVPESGEFQKTKRDLPDEGYSHPYMGKLAKLDLDGDFNYDGVVSNSDPTDGGDVQEVPPGLVVGVGELTQMIIRLYPHTAALRAATRLEFQVIGINRSVKTGDFGSLEEEIASMGHIRVWADSSRSKLLLDSRKTGSRIWTMPLPDLYNETLVTIPRAIWVEGVKASGAHTGDIRLDVRLIDVKGEQAPEPSNGKDFKNFKDFKQVETKEGSKRGFRPVFDHVLLTVAPTPHNKGYVNGNQEGVWSSR